jgi:SAM-dependent methyltransferase
LLLDIGCGSGIELKYIADYLNYAVGIDIDPDILKMAKKRLKDKRNVELVRADAYFLPFKPHSFTIICCFDVLEHLLYPSILLNEMHTLIKCGGKVIVRIPNKWSIHEILLRLVSPLTKAKFSLWYVRHVKFFDAPCILEEFTSRGFRYIRGYTVGSFLANFNTFLFTVVSIFLDLIISAKRQEVASMLKRKFLFSKPKLYEINPKSRYPSFSYLTMMFELEK